MVPDSSSIAGLLEPFGVTLDERGLELTGRYVDLLLRWNRAVNLTGVDQPDEIVTRHFGESLYLTTFAPRSGPLLDVGSGAGFPGMALKIIWPEIQVVLLEPIAKKRAFLKEVARACEFRKVEVSGERVEQFCESHGGEFGTVTVRAVGDFERVLRAARKILGEAGRLYAWLTRAEAARLAKDVREFEGLFSWEEPAMLPLSHSRGIWTGRRK